MEPIWSLLIPKMVILEKWDQPLFFSLPKSVANERPVIDPHITIRTHPLNPLNHNNTIRGPTLAHVGRANTHAGLYHHLKKPAGLLDVWRRFISMGPGSRYRRRELGFFYFILYFWKKNPFITSFFSLPPTFSLSSSLFFPFSSFCMPRLSLSCLNHIWPFFLTLHWQQKQKQNKKKG